MCSQFGLRVNALTELHALYSYLSLSGICYLVNCSVYCADEFKSFFSKYGKVVEHQIIRDHETNRSRGFGFIIFDSEEVVDDLLSKGNMIDMAGTQVSLFKTVIRKQSVHKNLFRYGACIIAFSKLINNIHLKKRFLFNF